MNSLHLAVAGFFAALGILGGADAHAESCDPRHAASPQYVAADCKFQNLANPDAKPSRGSWAIWTRFLTDKKVDTVPAEPIPVRALDRPALDKLDNTANHIVRLGHSSHLLKLRGKYWLIDPVFGARASPVSWAGPMRFHPSPLPLHEVPPIEGLILSHDHYDHLDAPTIEALKHRVQRYFVPLGVGARLRDMGVPADRIEELDWWQAARHGEVGLTATPAQHFSGRTLWDRNQTLWASWVIRSGGESIFYSGDSGYFPGFKAIGEKLGPFDLALMENGAYDSYWPAVHMSPEETVRAFQDVKARTLYLVHNSTFDLAFHPWREPLERVAQLAEQQGLALATPEIGEVLTLGRPRENKLWWRSLP
ncbi:MBL fold metallo-hydrolase [Aquincola sp. S2]|uniref:MBL fold metallo-hydrolase n=1 Tax=Pseudaquabacterium terrae TaxID=2732868 RepID=A0ABX2EBL9_9BURK|nr:MBL fold metallo-hydrolase [Aquabacterium terrae]NRF65936.1 MBL fold metallo-hydrolase [Aquabacterium terrae]